MKEIKVIDENTIYINDNGHKYILSWKINANGDYIAYCHGNGWYNTYYTEIGDEWMENAFCCLPMSVQKAFSFVRFN